MRDVSSVTPNMPYYKTLTSEKNIKSEIVNTLTKPLHHWIHQKRDCEYCSLRAAMNIPLQYNKSPTMCLQIKSRRIAFHTIFHFLHCPGVREKTDPGASVTTDRRSEICLKLEYLNLSFTRNIPFVNESFRNCTSNMAVLLSCSVQVSEVFFN